MKKIIFCFIITLLSSLNYTFAQMSDEQVTNYIKQEYTKGASQQSIANDLIKKGVTREQLERIQKSYGNKNTIPNNRSINQDNTRLTASNRNRTVNTFSKDDLINEDEDINTLLYDFSLNSSEKDSIKVFGRDIFNAKNLTFSPNVNIPTPTDYSLGPGDEVIIDIWGASQTSVRQTISPEGSIMVDRLGPIFLNGMTIKEANDYVQKKFVDIYSGIESEGTSQIKLTLGQIRTIQVNVIGEVLMPGTYSLSSLSSAFHALYFAGGVNKIGSLRSVKLFRNGKLLRTLDIYKYLMEGKLSNDIGITDGDVIIVPAYSTLVNVSGNVRRPMYYELVKGESLSNLIKYAGGFAGDAYTKSINVRRSTGGESSIFTIFEDDFGSFTLQDKDLVTIGAGLDDLFENRVEITGAVFRSGYYEIGKNINTVKELISAAEGTRGDAFLNRAVLTREKEDYTTEVIPIDIRNLLYGDGADIVLRKNDVLFIPSIHDLKEHGSFVIHGEVSNPGEYKYSDNTTLEDLIIQAGGLLESASTVRVDIARRIINPNSIHINTTLSEAYSFSIKDGFVIDGESGFILQPYDQIYVRRSPGYHEQQNVYIEGEILFPGAYSLNKKAERISDLVKRAGGLNPGAYAEGARLVRVRSEEEKLKSQTALKMASQSSKDSISVDQLELGETFNIGIQLDKAVSHPESDYDLVLREGDKLIIPEYDNTVKINGAVMYPNTVAYKKGEKLSYYINQAGGYSDNAKKNKSYVIYMNGTVSKIKGRDRDAIQPGSEIIVPSKEQSRRLSLPEVISLGTSITSMASLIGVLINTMK